MQDEIIPQLNNNFNTSGFTRETSPAPRQIQQDFSKISSPELPEVGPTTYGIDLGKATFRTGYEKFSNSSRPSIGQLMNPDKKAFQLTTTVPMSETHTLSEDGKTWIPKYETYIKGVDNEARIESEKKEEAEKQRQEYKEAITETYEETSSSIAGQIILAIIIAGVIILLYNLMKSKKSI